MGDAPAWARLTRSLRNIRWSGERQFTACCPAHRDQEPSLSVSIDESGKVLVKCFAGCEFSSVVRATNLTEQDFFPPNPEKYKGKHRSRLITLAELAKAKHFDIEFLNSIGVYDYPRAAGGVLIAYADESGELTQRQRWRTAVRAKDGCEWTGPKGVPLVPYGLWKLDEARERKLAVIVEGETDCWALWAHGWPALGLPGAANISCLAAAHLRGLDRLYVMQEPDPAGASFSAKVAARAKELRFGGEILTLRMPAGAKDPCDLHIAGTFDQEFQWAIENAAQLGVSGAKPLREDCNIAGSDLELRTQATFAAVEKINGVSGASPELFSNCTELMLLQEGRATPVNLARMRQWLTAHLNFQSYDRRGNLSPVTPADVLVQNVMVYKPSPLPHLTRVVRRPVFADDGRLIIKPGYDEPSGLVYAPTARLADVKPGDDVQAALALLADLIYDFNFETPADRAHFYAFLFQPIFRELIDGPTPIYRFEAPTSGTGKGLLFNLGATIYGGHVFTTPHGNEEEWAKSLLTHLRTNPEMLLIDNCSNLDSDQLAAATTAWPLWNARLLGTLDSFSVPVRCLWAVTINNPQLKEDVYRRTVRIRIVPGLGVENPSTRTNFRHRPLLAYLQANLPAFVSAVLTLAVFAKESMRPFTIRTMGSYDSWANVMGGVLEALNILGFLEVANDTLARNRDDIAWNEFIALWHEKLGDTWVRSSDLLKIAQEAEIDLGNGNDRSQQSTLGKRLAARRGKIFKGLLLDARDSDNRLQYRVVDSAEK